MRYNKEEGKIYITKKELYRIKQIGLGLFASLLIGGIASCETKKVYDDGGHFDHTGIIQYESELDQGKCKTLKK